MRINFFSLRPALLPGLFSGCLLAVLLLLAVSGQAQDRCGTARNDSLLSRRILNWKLARLRLEEKIQEQQQSQLSRARGTGAEEVVIRVPVVVHVIHTNAAGVIGGEGNGNISDEQILSQLQVLNEDYRRKPGTNGFNTNPVGADMELEFALATRDPTGNPSAGIIRVYSPKAEFDIFSDAKELADLSVWPTDKYLNIWVTTFSNSSYLGIAQYPSAGDVEGLDNSEAESAATDGVIIDHRTFGRNTGTATSGVYTQGRTTTHEIGHWLGLIHTWGDAVCGTDYCADTPPAERPNRSRFCTPLFSTCNGTKSQNMIENYLDYSPDLCMNVFTQNQKQRVRTVFLASPRRRRLLNSVTALPETETLIVQINPNPVQGSQIGFSAQFTGTRDVEVSILDVRGIVLKRSLFPEQPGNQLSVARQTLPSGLYLLRIQAGDEVAVKRFYLTD